MTAQTTIISPAFGGVSPSYAPAKAPEVVAAEDAVSWLANSGERGEAHRQAVDQAYATLRTEQERDPSYCMEQAAWLEGLADQQEANGKFYAAEDNRIEAARLRSVALGIMAPERRAAA